ncbi:DUF6625 family protein [Mangrovimonas cancribranchiae]|uniref:DUF6625 family protein n=1 Tax=Mangrovimonas cancribranchiae TaxID=3080055 RepID=A0AAU6P8Q5_9FLAO
MKDIILIIPYFGQWPVWFDAFLSSVVKNPTIHWLCPTNCPIPKTHPENITFLPTTLSTLNTKVNTIVSANVPLTPRKFCDLKPAYGDIFYDEIRDYDYWGFCDLDIVWGDIRQFITPRVLDEYDIISSRKEAISGHFTLFRNTNYIQELYKKLPNYKTLFEHPKFQWTDEVALTNYLKNNQELKVYWPKILCNQERGRDSHQDYYLDRWQWQDGKMINTKTNKEVMYLHFINWKRTMRYCEVDYSNLPSHFFISYNGIHVKRHSSGHHVLNNIKNVFNGYWVKEKRRIRKLKLKSLIKRGKNKLRKVL